MKQIYKRKQINLSNILATLKTNVYEPIFNIPEEPRYISSMRPTVFINGQYESGCYVNSSLQVFFCIFLDSYL